METTDFIISMQFEPYRHRREVHFVGAVALTVVRGLIRDQAAEKVSEIASPILTLLFKMNSLFLKSPFLGIL